MGIKDWSFVDEEIDDATIEQVEKSFGVTFPQDYKDCVKKKNGGYPEPNNFDDDNGGSAVFSDLLSFTNKEMNIKMFYEFELDSLTGKIIPFARDPFGNLICFDYRANEASPTIVFFDHEEVGEEAIEPICKTFTELLDRLYSIEEDGIY